MTDRQRSILITGAASGIGRATAVALASEGWLVGAFDRDAAGLASLADECQADHLLTGTLDITDRNGVLAAIASFGERTGGTLDLLFANAGIDAKGPFADMAWDRVRTVVEVNLIGAMSVIHAALPLLKATPGSLCLSTASGSAIFGTANLAAYSASKHGVRGLTEALAVELAPHGVRVADILPGIIDTGMLPDAVKARLPKDGMWRAMPADAVAATVLAAYRGDKLHWYVPEELAAYDLHVTAHPEQARDERINGPSL